MQIAILKKTNRCELLGLRKLLVNLLGEVLLRLQGTVRHGGGGACGNRAQRTLLEAECGARIELESTGL